MATVVGRLAPWFSKIAGSFSPPDQGWHLATLLFAELFPAAGCVRILDLARELL